MPDLLTPARYEGLARAAELSPCGRYRLSLRRSWKRGGDGRSICFIMLNPSTADGLDDDPTCRRCMGFARAWGFSVLSVRNLFTVRATNPAELRTASDPVGPRADVELRAALSADLVVAAWGTGVPFGRDREAMKILAAKPLFCLGTTKDGSPRHPLYVKNDTELAPFNVLERAVA